MASAAKATSSASLPGVIDLEALLAPIPGDNPAGVNLQYFGLHDDIREARRSEDSFAQGDWRREMKSADWPQVAILATDALATKTKDLQVCAWLVEALVKLYGFPGLRDGLRLVRGMLERFWDNLYPEIDEGDLEARANSLAWMDHYRHLPLAIKEVPITRTISGANYCYLQWHDSKQFDVPENLEELDSEGRRQVEETRRRAEEEHKITTEQWRVAKNATRRAFYEEMYALTGECWEEFLALDRAMDERFENQTPGLSALKKSIDEVRSLVEKLVKEKRILEPDPITPEGRAETETQEDQLVGELALAETSGPVRTRQEALRRLAEVADYFRKAEPHSPVSYLVERAIKWGQMPLESWLEDVIKNSGVLDELRETLGLKTESDGSNSSK